MLSARTAITRNISSFLDRWYMACSRAIMMTGKMIQWNLYHFCNCKAHHKVSEIPQHSSNPVRCKKSGLTNGQPSGSHTSDSLTSVDVIKANQEADHTHTHPCRAPQLIREKMQALVQKAHCICHWDCWNTDCMSLVRRYKNSGCDLEETYTVWWCWLWEKVH